MTVGLGEWASASASESSLRFHRDRARVLDEATPRSASRLAEGLRTFRETEQRLQPQMPQQEIPLGAGTFLGLGETMPPMTAPESRFFGVPGPPGEVPFPESELGLEQRQWEWQQGKSLTPEEMEMMRPREGPGGILDTLLGLAGKAGTAYEWLTDPRRSPTEAIRSLEDIEAGYPAAGPPDRMQSRVFEQEARYALPPSHAEMERFFEKQLTGPLAREFLHAVSLPYEAGETAFEEVTGVPARGKVSGKIKGEISQDILQGFINPANIAMVAPFAMQGTAGLTGAKLVTQITSNLVATGMEPSLIRGSLRGTTAIVARGTAALDDIPKVIRETPIIQDAVRLIREGEAGGLRVPGAAEDVARMRLTNDIPSIGEIRSRLVEIDAKLAEPKVKGGRAAMLAERAKVQAQADIDDILASDLPALEQFKAIEAELDGLRIELQTRGLPFRGKWSSRQFVPSEKDMPMGGLSAEERAARPGAAQSRAAREARAEPRYPDLSTKELNARERVYDEFLSNARYEEVPAEELVGRARFDETGEVVREPTYATEGELAGVRPRQAELGIGAGERPFEEAGPMFRQGDEMVGGVGGQPAVSEAVTQPPSPAPPPPSGPPPRKPPAPPMPDPEPPKIPTVREVEAGSKPLPPHIRAQMMGEIEDPRVPLMGWDEFAELWGPRFQENWVTKAQDFLGGVVKPLRRTPQAVAVRNAMVMSDLYTGVQKTRMRALLFDWIGRHSSTLGLRQGKFARNVAVREGADISKGLEQRVMHIAEHPEKYIPTTEQRAALDELQAVGDHVLQQELRHGIDIEPIVGEYVHRIVTHVPEGMPKPRAGLPGGGLRFPRVRPPYARGRSEVGLEALWGAGYRYADDLESIAARWDTAVDAIANRKTLDTIKDLGIKPSARVPEEVREAARVARDEFKAARVTAKSNPTTVNRAALAEAETNLVNSRHALRLAAKHAAEGQPKVFGRITSPEAAEELARYLDVAGPGAVEEAFRLARANMIMGDLSAMGIQGWYTFWRDTPTWINASARSLQAFAENPYAFVVRNIDAIERGTRYGAIFPPTEFLLRMGGGLTRRFGRLPFVKQTQRSFEWWMFTAQTLRWKAVEGVTKSADELLELAAVLRKQTGVSLMPGLTKAQRRGSQVFFAPKFLAAMLGTLTDAAKAGPAGWEARRTVATAFGGATAAVVAGNITQGKKPNLSDPDEPGFFGIRAKKGWLYPLGPFQPLVVALYRNGRATQDLVQGETPRPRDLQAWPRFMESKLNVYEQALLRMAEATGLPLESIRGQPFRGPAFGERGTETQEATRFGPIGIVQAAEGIARGAYVTAAEVAGVRTTVQTPYQQVRETWERERGNRNIPDVPFDEAAQRWQIAEQDPVLAPLVEQMYGRSEEMGTPGAERAGAAEDVRLRLEESTGLIAEAQRIGDGQPGAKADFARAFDEYSDQAVGMNKTVYLDVAREISSEEQEKVRVYYEHLETGRASGKYRDPETGEFDHNAFYAESDRLFDELLPQTRKAMEEDIKSVNPLVRQYEPEYREARQIRSEAYEMPRHQGISIEEEREARDFRSLVDQARDRMAGGGLDPGDVTIQLYLAVAEDNGVAPKVAYLAFALRPNSKGEISLRDIRYAEFLIDNASKLAPYFPQLYPRRMLPALDPEIRESVIAGG